VNEKTMISEMIADLGIDLIKDIIVRLAMEPDGEAKAKFLQALKEMKKTLGVNPDERRWNIIEIVRDISRLRKTYIMSLNVQCISIIKTYWVWIKKHIKLHSDICILILGSNLSLAFAGRYRCLTWVRMMVGCLL